MLYYLRCICLTASVGVGEVAIALTSVRRFLSFFEAFMHKFNPFSHDIRFADFQRFGGFFQ